MQRLGPIAILVSLAAFAAVTPDAAKAQSNPLHFNIAAGASIPTGDFGQFADVGYNITGGVGMQPRNSPLGFRAEAMYNEFGLTDTDGEKVRVGAGILNALYNIPVTSMGTGSSLYVIGGVGYYNTDDTFLDDSEGNIGWNVGAGFRFPLTGFSAYIEARYHTVSNNNVENVHFFPIVFGLSF